MSFEINNLRPFSPVEATPSPQDINNIDTFFGEQEHDRFYPYAKGAQSLGFRDQTPLLKTETAFLEEYFQQSIAPNYIHGSTMTYNEWIASGQARKAKLSHLDQLPKLMVDLRSQKSNFFQMPDGPLKQRGFEALEPRFQYNMLISGLIRDLKNQGSESTQGRLLIGDATTGATEIAAAFARLSWLQLGRAHLQGIVQELDTFTKTRQKWSEDKKPQLPDPYDVAYFRFDNLADAAINNESIDEHLLTDIASRRIVVISGYDHIGKQTRTDLLRRFIDIRVEQKPTSSNTIITSPLPLTEIFPESMYPNARATVQTVRRTLRSLVSPVEFPQPIEHNSSSEQIPGYHLG